MPKGTSKERRKLLKAYGAKVYLTKAAGGTNYAIKVAKKILKEDKNYLMLDQFSNETNVLAHYHTTGKEIIKDVPQITHFVAGIGTGGTLTGVGKRLKEFNPRIKIIGVVPKKSNSKIQGLRNMKAYKPPIFQEEILDEKLLIDDEAAFEFARKFIKKEGLISWHFFRCRFMGSFRSY